MAAKFLSPGNLQASLHRNNLLHFDDEDDNTRKHTPQSMRLGLTPGFNVFTWNSTLELEKSSASFEDPGGSCCNPHFELVQEKSHSLFEKES